MAGRQQVLGAAPPDAPNVDERARQLGNLPLFMRELPEGQVDEDAALQMEALQSLLYEGDPEERAQNFKAQGNENFVAKRFKEALAFYTQGLGDLSPELHVETKRTLYCNRAACNLELGNYRACIRDCAAVLEDLDKPVPEQDAEVHRNTTLKALFRCARALVALDRLDDARDALERYHSEGGRPDAGVSKLQTSILDKIAYRDKIRAERAERERRTRLGDEALATAIKSLRLALPAKWSPSAARSACPAEIKPPHFDPEALQQQHAAAGNGMWMPPSIETPLVFPVFLLRPLANPPTRDLILTFHQDVTFGDQLDAFNAQNAASQPRKPEEETIYAVTKLGRILKVGRKLTIRKIAEAAGQTKDGQVDGLDLVEGWCLEFYIVPKGSEETRWIAEMKARIRNS